ncbi:hypothetical protein NECID01_0356 [Nematocida sp. AWRm77]|nr:hypothetical protein NECID01_0356 [Nematocida sp. AWRm77]
MDHIRFANYTQMASSSVCLLKNASFSLRKGKMTALIGLSGEGKSTLMNAIVGLDKSNKKAYGEILVEENGEMVPRDPVKWFQRVGYVRQGFINYKNMTVMDILKSVCKCYGQSEEKIEVFLGKLRMLKTKKTKYKDLSGGEQRRIMTIIGLLNNTELNIWDEPLTGLDSEIAHTSLAMMRASGKTNLVSVHQVSDDLMKLFDDLVVVHNTTIIYSGPIENLHSYFGQHKVSFPTDIFYINYIIRLSAGNTNTTEDMQNVENFNKLADSILNKETEKTQPAIKPRMFVPFSMPSITRIKEVYKRSLFFNKKFKGSNMVLDILIVGFFTANFAIAIYQLNKHNFDVQKDKAINDLLTFLETNAKSNPMFESCLKVFSWMRNIAIACITPNYIMPIISIILTILFCSYISSLVDKEYYTLCCQCIEEKQFTNVDMICAVVFDLVIRKFLLSFIIMFCIEALVYNNGFLVLLRPIEGCLSFGYGSMLVCSILFASLIFLYSAIATFMPLPPKIISFLAPILGVFLILIPYSIYIVQTRTFGSTIYTWTKNHIFYDGFNPENNYEEINEFINQPRTLEAAVALFKEGWKKRLESFKEQSSTFQKILMFLMPVIITALQYSPPAIVLEYYTKVGVYLGYMPITVLEPPSTVVNSVVDIILDNETNNISMQDTISQISALDVLNPRKYSETTNFILSEIFDMCSPLTSCTFVTVAWGLLRFFVFPTLVLSIFMVYYYKSLQPSLK